MLPNANFYAMAPKGGYGPNLLGLSPDDGASALRRPLVFSGRKSYCGNLDEYVVIDWGKPTPPERLALDTVYTGSVPHYVNWGTFQVKSWDEPLETDGLAGCSALVLINPKTKQHALGHAYPESGFNNFEEEMKKFKRTPETEYYVLPGAGPYGVALSIHAILEHLRKLDPTLVPKVKLLDPSEMDYGEKRHIVIHQGKMYKKYPPYRPDLPFKI